MPMARHAVYGHWRTMAFAGALLHNRINALPVLDGPVNGEAFCAYVEPALVSPLGPGNVL